MNTTISVSSASISGVTLICGLQEPRPAFENGIGCSSQFLPISSSARACLQDQTPVNRSKFPSRHAAFELVARLESGVELSVETSTANKRTVIVTGGSRGMGSATARLLGAKGYPVAVNFVNNEDAASAVVRDIVSGGGKAVAIRADIGQEQEILKLFATSNTQLGPLGGLVNNAAITGGFARVQDVTSKVLAEVFAVNIVGAMLCAREAVRRFSTDQGRAGGCIVNISSIAARTGAAGEWVHYAASKGAINSFTVGLAREVAAQGIRVNAVAPGLIETDLHAHNGAPDRLLRFQSSIPMGRAGTAAEVAEAVAWLLSPAASYVTGSILEVGGGR